MTEVALRFELLGPVRAYRGAEPVDLGPPRQQAVLAILLLHAGTPVPMRQIIAALWNGDPPENGTDVVQRCVGALRRTLDPQRTSLIALVGDGYVLRAGEQAVDTGLFRAALTRARAEHQAGTVGAATGEVRDALSRWPDQPLAGLTGAVFESARAWLQQERTAAADLLAEPVATAPAPPEPPPTRPETRRPGVDPRHREPISTKLSPERPAPAPTRRDPMSANPTAGRPALDPTRLDPAPAHPTAGRTDPDPAHPEPSGARPAYPEPTDPWAGHELFPPDPGALG